MEFIGDTYEIATPAGAFSIVFGEESSTPEYRGDETAIAFFKNWIEINQVSGEHGYLLDANNIQPNELYGFCQPVGSGIVILPPLDDMVAFNENEIFENQDTEFENMDMTYDAATGAEKLKLIKELGGIRSSIATVKSGIEKLKLVKRVKEIRDLLGVKSEMEPQPEPHQVEEAKNTLADVNEVMPMLKQFIGNSQMTAFASGIRGEEGQFIKDKLIEIANTIQSMPKIYGQDGMGDKAVAYLHYFKGSGDWYITEKDMEDEQLQTFGLADPFGDGGELGYISIQELIDSGVELDFYWTPKTIGEIKGSKGREIQETADVGDKSYADKNNNESLEMMKSKVGAKVEWWMAGSVKRTGVIVDAKKVESEFQFEDEVKHELVYVVKPDSSFKTEGETINFAPSEITFIENNLLGSGHDASRSFLQSVINGTADMDSKTFANEIEKAAEQLGDDNELVIQAANVYADYVTKKSKELLQ